MSLGEILKRPTRADCKSAVKTSQVRILLSPQKKSRCKSGLFIYTKFSFYSKIKLTLTFTTIAISPIANVSLGVDSEASLIVVFIANTGAGDG